MMPKGWGIKPISKVGKVVTGSTPSTKSPGLYGGEIPFVSPGDLGFEKYISTTEKNLTQKGFETTRAVRKGATLFTCIGSTIGKIGLAGRELATNQQINSVIPEPGSDDEFVYYSLEYRSAVIARLSGTQAVPIINKKTFEAQLLPCPPLEEQKRIGQILASWDKAISVTKKLLTNSQQQKTALMQKLLTGKRRLPGLKDKWKEVPLTDCLNGSGLRNSQFMLGEDSIMSVNKTEGMLPMRKQTIGKSIDRYKIVKPGWFAYNPMRLNVGSICRWHSDSDCLVSPDYVVFSCNEDVLLGSYFDQFRQAGSWEDFMKKAGNGSVRVRIYLKDLEFLKIPLPPLREQEKIVAVLEAADQEIFSAQRKIDLLKQEKKALMQQLLTGKRRVLV